MTWGSANHYWGTANKVWHIKLLPEVQHFNNFEVQHFRKFTWGSACCYFKLSIFNGWPEVQHITLKISMKLNWGWALKKSTWGSSHHNLEGLLFPKITWGSAQWFKVKHFKGWPEVQHNPVEFRHNINQISAHQKLEIQHLLKVWLSFRSCSAHNSTYV